MGSLRTIAHSKGNTSVGLRMGFRRWVRTRGGTRLTMALRMLTSPSSVGIHPSMSDTLSLGLSPMNCQAPIKAPLPALLYATGDSIVAFLLGRGFLCH